jgi:hypothetical protein
MSAQLELLESRPVPGYHKWVLEGDEAMAAIVRYAGEARALALRPHIVASFFRLFAGRALDDARLHTKTAKGTEVKLTFKDQYSKMCAKLATLLNAVPKAEPHVQVVNTLKLEFEKIPAEKQQPLVDRIIAAAQELEITEGITASECVQPKPGFHAQRCIILSPEDNVAFDEILPITAYPQL